MVPDLSYAEVISKVGSLRILGSYDGNHVQGRQINMRDEESSFSTFHAILYHDEISFVPLSCDCHALSACRSYPSPSVQTRYDAGFYPLSVNFRYIME